MSGAKSIPHYSALSLRNFRGFRQLRDLSLAPLTFLVGPNSSGKSSLFDALLLLVQSGLGHFPPGRFVPEWGGPVVDLGSFEDAVYGHRVTLPIVIETEIRDIVNPWRDRRSSRKGPSMPVLRIRCEIRSSAQDQAGRFSRVALIDQKTKVEISFRKGRGKRPGVNVRIHGTDYTWRPTPEHAHRFEDWLSQQISETRGSRRSRGTDSDAALSRLLSFIDSWALLIFMLMSERVASGRAGPQRWYPRSGLPDELYSVPGQRPSVFDRVSPKSVTEAIESYTPGVRRRSTQAYSKQVAAVLKRLEIAESISSRSLSAYHSTIDVTDNITGIESNLIDVGYGASQVLPVIRGCLSPSIGPLFVEQPEIHLHPRAQGAVADLLCDTSEHRQVVVETHSEHMINRARIRIAEGEMDPDDVIVVYVDRDAGGSYASEIRILEDGEFDTPWPRGFFDERYEDTMRLLALQEDSGG